MKPYARIVTDIGVADVYDHGSCDHDDECDCPFPIEVVPRFPCDEKEVRKLEWRLFQGCCSGTWLYGAWRFERL